MTYTPPTILKAFWQSEATGILIFNEDWPLEAIPCVLYQNSPMPLSLLKPEEILKIQGHFIDKEKVHFQPLHTDYPHLDPEKPLYLTGDWTSWQPKALELTPTTMGWEIEISVDLIFAEKDKVSFKYMSCEGVWLNPPPHYWNKTLTNPQNLYLEKTCTTRHLFTFSKPQSYTYLDPLSLQYGSKTIWIDSLPLLLKHSSQQTLGVTLTSNQTTFRIFAPRAHSIELHLEYNDKQFENFALEKNANGVWEITLEKNLEGTRYAYRIKNPEDPTLHQSAELVLDPYAKLIDTDKRFGIITAIKEKKSFYTPPKLEECIILEAHVKDLITKVPDLKHKGFRGLTEWIEGKNCYLKDLGINVLELQPLQAFDESINAYHWGYMTINYFAIAPDYAINPLKVHEEFKEFVKSAHDQGLSIVVDVVYNHVGNPNHLAAIDKGYYFRLSEEGHFENWSGCGNDLRTEAPMVKRLILESLLHWVKCYDVDGFRFDLADLVGKEVLEEIRPHLQKLKPGILLIAEPWSFKSHIGLELKETEWSSWNDGFREFIPKYVKGDGNSEGLLYFMKGSTDHLTRYATQSINYVESHDDRTWIDKITENESHDGSNPTSNDIRRTHLMLGILMASRGVPMLSAGQDFLRSKGGVTNTYERLKSYPHTAQYFREWIAFRKSSIGQEFFQKNDHELTLLRDEASNACILHYGKKLMIALNPHSKTVLIDMQNIEASKYHLIGDIHQIKMEGISQQEIVWNSNGICLPPLSLGIFTINRA